MSKEVATPEIKFEEAEDGFALFVADVTYNYSIEVKNDEFFKTGEFTVNFDDKDKEHSEQINEEAIKIMTDLVEKLSEDVKENEVE